MTTQKNIEKRDSPPCPAMSFRLNCGCCDDVILACVLEAGHEGDHVDIQRKLEYQHGSPTPTELLITVKWSIAINEG